MKERTEHFRTEDAAEYIGLSASTLKKLRMHGGGPVFMKLGARVLYRRTDIDEWLLKCRRTLVSGDL